MRCWYRAVNPDAPSTIEHTYNMVDITKSYVASTQRGIVLDLKIGPSEHVNRCEAAGIFDKHFVSFGRGASTLNGLPENQCLGTMQAENTLRAIYAKRFDQALAAFNGAVERGKTPNDKHFDFLTGLHGKGWVALKRAALDVANQQQMEALGLFNMPVQEIADEMSYGPFRVFKRKADQTNTSMASTSPQEQVELCEYTCRQAQSLRLVVNDVFQQERTRVGVKMKASVYFS
jgi:hypothetical protein